MSCANQDYVFASWKQHCVVNQLIYRRRRRMTPPTQKSSIEVFFLATHHNASSKSLSGYNELVVRFSINPYDGRGAKESKDVVGRGKKEKQPRKELVRHNWT